MDERIWQTWCKKFGPIMEPAYKNDPESRVKLTEALEYISQRQLNKAIESLQEIREKAICDADTAAWSFFVGFCFELAGRKENMKHCYEASIGLGHRFYLPHLKLALMEHGDANFEAAYEHYSNAIVCLGETEAVYGDSASLLKAWRGLVSCLTMMHRYSEAEELYLQAEGQEDMDTCGAVLYAALGKRQKSLGLLEIVETKRPEQAESLRQMTEQILDGSHPHFHPQPMPAGAIERFWQWFCDNEEELRGEMEETLAPLVAEQLKEVISFLERDAELRAERKGKTIRLYLKDRYAIALQQAYGRLINSAPAFEDWSFAIEH